MQLDEKTVLHYLLEDPTRSAREIAKELKSYRQKVWREKTRLEEEKIIWGYTAVVNEEKMNQVLYLILLKTKPMSKEFADILIMRKLLQREPEKQNVRIINVLFVNGEYDWIVMFSAPDHATARRYYDSVRIDYEKLLIEKPVIVDVNFSIVREGKINPEIKKIYDFIPVK